MKYTTPEYFAVSVGDPEVIGEVPLGLLKYKQICLNWVRKNYYKQNWRTDCIRIVQYEYIENLLMIYCTVQCNERTFFKEFIEQKRGNFIIVTPESCNFHN